MAWVSQDLDQEICLTCQHFRVGRRLKNIGGRLFIEYDATKGGCGIYNNFPKLVNERVMGLSYCRYRRWADLP